MELVQDRFQRRDLELAVLNFRVLLSDNKFHLMKMVVSMVGGWNWLRIIFRGGIWN
jgi:hypothetical protein